jgi:chaperonin GroEL
VIGQQVEATKSEYEKEKLQERLAKLSGGVAVLKVGGGSEAEVSEKKDRVTDALNATRAAVEDGIVAGGGSALLHASKVLDSLIKDEDNRDIRTGYEIIQKAVRMPARAISDNAAYDGVVIASKVLEYDDVNMGYNAQTGEFVNMLDSGILDPSKVVKTALIDANSVSSLMVTTQSAICDLPAKEGEGGGMGGMPGGMGGMGGMPGMM